MILNKHAHILSRLIEKSSKRHHELLKIVHLEAHFNKFVVQCQVVIPTNRVKELLKKATLEQIN